MSDDKLNRIEETLSYQEKQIDDLSEMVILQGAELEALKKHMIRMHDKITTLEDTSPEGKNLSSIEQAARDKPPHY